MQQMATITGFDLLKNVFFVVDGHGCCFVCVCVCMFLNVLCACM